MPRIKDGFKGERAIVLPAFLIEELKQDPLGSELYITDIGYYPHACFITGNATPRKQPSLSLFIVWREKGGLS